MATAELLATRLGEPAAACDGVVRVYRTATGETHALRGLDLTVPRGELTVVAGPSGSGKSTLLGLLAGQDRPSAGQVRLLGHDLSTVPLRTLRMLRRTRVGYVPERPARALFPHLGALDQLHQRVALCAAGREPAGGLAPAAVLEAVGLVHREHHRPATLSGGEQQRLAVALALVGAPSLVVADEPTAELDHENADRVLAVLGQAARAGTAVVVSSHDPRVVGRADRVVRLRHGVLASEEAGAGRDVAVIDSTGRVQLPPAALARFPGLRAEVLLEEDGSVRLTPPAGGAGR